MPFYCVCAHFFLAHVAIIAHKLHLTQFKQTHSHVLATQSICRALTLPGECVEYLHSVHPRPSNWKLGKALRVIRSSQILRPDFLSAPARPPLSSLALSIHPAGTAPSTRNEKKRIVTRWLTGSFHMLLYNIKRYIFILYKQCKASICDHPALDTFFFICLLFTFAHAHDF